MIIKKITLFCFLFFSFFTLVNANNISKVSTDNKSILKNHLINSKTNINIDNYIFKIKAFSHNEKFWYFREDSIGSAVLIWNNELLTNAHVVLDDNKKPYEYLVACYNENSKNNPDCNYFVSLKYIDIANDLAILKFDEFDIKIWKYNFIKGVNFYEKEVNIKDDLQVYWYPFIGWDTITFTKWKISWFTPNWDIKTDSLIDWWNSWWWAFINDKLVWISSYIISNNQSIWYIKSLKHINEFIKNKKKYKVDYNVFVNFKLYYSSIYLYKDWLWTYNKGWLNLEWMIKDFKLNEIIYSNSFSFLNFYWVDSNKDTYLEIISTRIFNRNNFTNKQIVNWISEVLFPNLKKECFTIKNKHLWCNVYYSSDWEDYLKFVWFEFLKDNLFITIIDSKKDNWKVNKDLINMYLSIYKKMDFSTLFNSNVNYFGDFNISLIPDYTKILIPVFYNNQDFKVLLLNNKDPNIISSINIINDVKIKKNIELWFFKYDNYIEYLKYDFSKYESVIGKSNIKLEKDSEWRYYIFVSNNLFYSYFYFSYDWYLYNVNFSLKKDSSNSKSNIINSMNNFNLLSNLNTTTDLKKLDFSQKYITDLDDKWYVYEDTLIDWEFSWYWEMYYIPSKNKNIAVIDWKILLFNNKTNGHINIAQDIIFNKNLLNKWFIFRLKPLNLDYNSKIYVRMIVFSKIEWSEKNYYSYTYRVTNENIENIKTDIVWDLIDLWRKEYNLSNDIYPDVVRISVWIWNTTYNKNAISIDDITLYEENL